jgi:hypothetical protein
MSGISPQQTGARRSRQDSQAVPGELGRSDPPDTRLVEMVRLLARQAARDYHEQSRRDAEHPGD